MKSKNGVPFYTYEIKRDSYTSIQVLASEVEGSILEKAFGDEYVKQDKKNPVYRAIDPEQEVKRLLAKYQHDHINQAFGGNAPDLMLEKLEKAYMTPEDKAKQPDKTDTADTAKA